MSHYYFTVCKDCSVLISSISLKPQTPDLSEDNMPHPSQRNLEPSDGIPSFPSINYTMLFHPPPGHLIKGPLFHICFGCESPPWSLDVTSLINLCVINSVFPSTTRDTNLMKLGNFFNLLTAIFLVPSTQ